MTWEFVDLNLEFVESVLLEDSPIESWTDILLTYFDLSRRGGALSRSIKKVGRSPRPPGYVALMSETVSGKTATPLCFVQPCS